MNEEKVREQLREVIDPELGVNIVDLGLLEQVLVSDNRIHVAMLLTSPVCPMGGYIRDQATQMLSKEFPEVEVDVQLLSAPRWNPGRMSAEAKQQLGWG
jgi:metal-sulfur cluster biosynthetic enzyme